MTDKEIATSKEDILKQLRNLSSDLFLSGIVLQEYLKTPDIPNRIFLDDMSLRFRYMSARLTTVLINMCHDEESSKEIATSKEDILKQLRNLSSDLLLSGIVLQDYSKTPDIPNRIFLDDMSLRFRHMSIRLNSDIEKYVS